MAVSPLGGQILVKEEKPQGFSEDPVPESQIFPVFRASAGDFQHGGAAAQAGQHRGIAPIVDTHVAIALLAVGLWIFGGTVVQSFGILLFLGAALSLFGALAVTRLMIRLFLPINSTSEKFYNVKREEESAQ